jgi:hypothetical protein
MVLNLTNKPPEWEKIQTTNKMVTNLKEYLTKEWLNYKEEWSKGSTPEELLNYTQPTEGDLECLVDRMEGVDFDTTLNQALRVFNYIK